LVARELWKTENVGKGCVENRKRRQRMCRKPKSLARELWKTETSARDLWETENVSKGPESVGKGSVENHQRWQGNCCKSKTLATYVRTYVRPQDENMLNFERPGGGVLHEGCRTMHRQ
jgi:hypothetical protein